MIAVKKLDGGIRPKGNSEIVRRIITKVIAWKIKEEVKQAMGSTQCSVLAGACESAYKAINELYNKGKAIFLLDAEGAYTNLSCSSTLKTAARVIPDSYKILHNFYQNSTRAFHNGKKFSIEEGTIQGCPLSSTIDDIGIIPLVREMESNDGVKIWVCDDLCASGEPEQLKRWYDKILERGPLYGYHRNKSKSNILSKEPRDID